LPLLNSQINIGDFGKEKVCCDIASA
jgi:hypothetical protein